jgi:hypothetical protein
MEGLKRIAQIGTVKPNDRLDVAVEWRYCERGSG